jgi:5-methylcytosine-specific restriction endonuclease McrA
VKEYLLSLGSRTNRKHAKKRPKGEIPCAYCFQEWATGYDHLLPLAAGGLDMKENLVPCCKKCNSILGSRVYESYFMKREFIRDFMIKRGIWKFPAEDE